MIIQNDVGFTVTKFVLVIGSLSLLFIAVGYVLKPVSKIVNELHDSSDSHRSSDESSSE